MFNSENFTELIQGCARHVILQQNNKGSKLHCSSLIGHILWPSRANYMANHEPTIMANQNNQNFGAKMQSRERNQNFHPMLFDDTVVSKILEDFIQIACYE